MDFTFSSEQDALRDVARSFLVAQAPSTYVRAMMDDDRGFTDEFWGKLVDLGWTGVLIPEANGGAGLGMLEAVVLAEEMGHLPLPGPWLSSSICATLVAVHLGDTDVLDGLASGHRRGTLAVEENGHRNPLDAVECVAERDGDGWVLNGVKPLVLDGHTADFAYVVARDGESLATFVVDSPAGELVPSMDVTRKIARLVLDRRPARRVGPEGDQRALLLRVVDDIGIILCAESVGACDRAVVMATEYAKVRVQFDRPIATFQAIRHKIVDMLHQLELARVATHYAAWVSDTNDAAREAAAASAKGFVAEAAAMITGENIQVHGGVGFTWDIDAHLLFRRVKAADVMFGRQGWQRERLADLVLSGAVEEIRVAEKAPMLGGRDIEDLNMGGARVRGAFLMDTRITDAFAVNLSIEGDVAGMKINGVEIAPLVAAELDRLHPTLMDLRPTTADGLRRGAEIVYGIWDELLNRVTGLDESLVHERVDGEWSFAETLRHLVYATDCWLRHVVLDDRHPYHAIAISHAPATGQDPGIDLAASPSFTETLRVRRESQAELRVFVADLTDDDLHRMCEPTASPGNPDGAFELGDALNVVLNEEYWHSTYAVRDLDVLTAAG